MKGDFLRGRLSDPSTTPAKGERVDRVFERDGIVIEHILSGELEKPASYSQPQHEWVVLLSGSARLRVGQDDVSINSGEWLFLPAELDHELVETTPGTRWLAVFFEPKEVATGAPKQPGAEW